MKPNLASLDRILRCETGKLFYDLFEGMKGYGYGLSSDGKKHSYYAGDLPILLVAHLDTVHKKPPNEIFYDTTQRVAWSPNGLGADDRAGVWAIMEILRRGYRPHVLFTDEEETGGHGAKDAVNTFIPDGVHCLIEMDRKGSTDAVYYMNDNPDYSTWIESFGFTKNFGSFTDISVLMPAWNLSGVNLSIGYYDQHTLCERLFVGEACATIDKVCKMLDSPPLTEFPFVERKYQATQWQGNYAAGDYMIYSDSLEDRVTPEHYRRRGLWKASEKRVAWTCVLCKHQFREGQELQPKNLLCRECVQWQDAKAAMIENDSTRFSICPDCGNTVSNTARECELCYCVIK